MMQRLTLLGVVLTLVFVAATFRLEVGLHTPAPADGETLRVVEIGRDDFVHLAAGQGGSIASVLGLAGDDVVDRVDGLPLHARPSAIPAALWLGRDHADRVDLDVRSGGRPVRILVLLHGPRGELL